MSFLNFYLMWASSTFFGLFHQERYCPEWDKALGSLLDKYSDRALVGRHTTTINGIEIWTANAFYSYGHIYQDGIEKRRPSLWNMYRLWLVVEAAGKDLARREREEYLRKMREVANG
nr:MAG TPA_asm: hypothetical protein [Caudoviricetes sp.]